MMNEPAMMRPHCTASDDQKDMTATVAVCALEPVSISAKRNSFHEKMKQNTADTARPGGQWQCHAPESFQYAVAVHHGGLFQRRRHLVEEALHEPDYQRDIRGGVDDDQGQRRIEKPGCLEDDVVGYDHGDWREHPQRQDPEGDIIHPAMLDPADRIGGKRAEEQAYDSRSQRDDQAVPDEFQEGPFSEEYVVMFPCRCEQERRGLLEHDRRRFHRRGRDQIDGRQEDDQHDGQQGIDQDCLSL